MIRKAGIVLFIAVQYITIIGAYLYVSQAAIPTAAGIDSVSYRTETLKKSDKITTGKPVRVSIPSRNIKLAIDMGGYDKQSGKWLLSDTNALFAQGTVLPNDKMGMTFIYGHGTDNVFGRIGSNAPRLGSVARVYTNNNLVFSYVLKSVRNLKSDETSILTKNVRTGSPRLVIQTCSGLFSEWRTMFTFEFDKVFPDKTGTR